MLGLSAGSMAGAAILRVLQALSSLTSHSINEGAGLESNGEQEEQAMMGSSMSSISLAHCG